MIMFMAFDTNGTILVSGVFERAMQDIPRFRKSIISNGMYQTLTDILRAVAHDHGSKVLGCSEGPRYIYPNDRYPMNTNASNDFITNALECCNVLRKQVLFLDKKDYSNHKEFESSLPKGCSASQYRKEYIDVKCQSFLRQISSAAGKGVGHMLSLTFFQLSCLVGILPLFLYSWASISKGSGGYQFVNSLLSSKAKKNVSIHTVNQWITKCSTELGASISSNINASLIENMLCEFKRESQSKSSISNKKDYLFFMDHRGSWQNLYRLEFKSPTNVSFYIRPGRKQLKVSKNKLTFDIGGWNIMLIDQIQEATKKKELLCWVNTDSSVASNHLHLDSSKIHVSKSLSKCFELKH